METDRPSDDPERRDAREALEEAARAADAVRRPAVPRWFFSVMAVLVALLLLAQLMPTQTRSTTMFGVVLVALLLNLRVQRGAGVAGARHDFRDLVLFLAPVLLVVAATALVATLTGWSWVWALGALVAAAAVLVAGSGYERRRTSGPGR